ncbi:MAG: YgcG family protein [Candidatus Izemoplasmatales bacterium]
MKKIIAFAFIIIYGVFFLVSCKNEPYPKPSNAYYVNDYADKFSPYLESKIRLEGERLFDEELDDGNQPGAQIVFATFAVENESDIETYNLSDIYNQWKIGKDDLGILVVYFYVGDKDKPESLELNLVQIEIGYAMEVYLSPSEAGAILDKTIVASEDEDTGSAHLLYELLTLVYDEVYDISFNYDLETYEYYREDYDEYSDYDGLWEWILFVILSPSSSWLEKGILSVLGIIFLGSGGLIIKNVAGGGGSGGMGIRRRK